MMIPRMWCAATHCSLLQAGCLLGTDYYSQLSNKHSSASGLVSGCRGLAQDFSLLEVCSVHNVHNSLLGHQLLLAMSCLLPYASNTEP